MPGMNGHAEPRNLDEIEHTQRRNTGDLPVLRNKLRSYHIIAIGLSGVIGAGALIDTGTALQISGPLATIFAYGFVGLVAMCVMECIADMVGTWPIANPFVMFVETFIDEDLGFVVGLGYWYTYAMGFQTLLVATANLADFWGMSIQLKAFVLFFICPFILVVINVLGVLAFANVELVAGLLKLLFVLVTIIMMICVNAGGVGNHLYIGSRYFDDGFQYNSSIANGVLAAFSESIVIAAFAFIGVEITAVTAFEAVTKEELRRPVKYIAPITIVIYFITVSVLVSDVKWCSPRLPRLWEQPEPLPGQACEGELLPPTHSVQTMAGIAKRDSTNTSRGYGISPATIALRNADSPAAAAFVNGFLIFAVLSAANTALYVASRTLFGLTRRLQIKGHPEGPHVTLLSRAEDWITSIFKKFGTVHPSTQVPAWALVVSWLVFCWIPFIELKGGTALLDLQEILSTLGSVACVLVWASQCGAFLCYYKWCKQHQSLLSRHGFQRYDRWHYEGEDRISTWLSFMQPALAWFGLCGCLVIAFVLTTATWWGRKVSAKRGISVFAFPAVVLLFYSVRKIRRREYRFLNHEFTWQQLSDRLDKLLELAEENRTDGQDLEMR